MGLENSAYYELHPPVIQKLKEHHWGKFARSLKANRKDALILWSLPNDHMPYGPCHIMSQYNL